MGHSLCSFILRQIPRRSPTHNAVYFTTTRLGGYTYRCMIPINLQLQLPLCLADIFCEIKRKNIRRFYPLFVYSLYGLVFRFSIFK